MAATARKSGDNGGNEGPAVKLRLEGLQQELSRRLLPVYVVSGDDPLLTGEAADAIRARARSAGYTEREVFYVERGGSSWSDVLQAAEALSLFASQRIVEVRMPSGKPDRGEGNREANEAALLRAIAVAGNDFLLLILTDRLDASSQASRWMQEADQRGACLTVWPVGLNEFPAWLQRRARVVELTLDAGAVELLAERTEGNLLAAKQELDKLALQLGPGAAVNAAAIAASSNNSARFGTFQFADVVVSGNAPRALRMLDGLRAEGTELPLIMWALLRAKTTMQSQSRRRPFARITTRAVRADRMAKGRLKGDAWDEVALLTAELCGHRVLPLERWQNE
jgi:DNA polymerase-3 subunit delta